MTTQNPKQIYNTLFISNKRLKERQTQTFNDLEEIKQAHEEVGKKIRKVIMPLKVSKSKLEKNNN